MSSHTAAWHLGEASPELPQPAMQAQFSVAIIGAGAAGIAVAKSLQAARLDYHIFERHSDFGGIWDINSPGSPMYASLRLISSKNSFSFSDYPMGESLPDYPSHEQVLSYLRTYARLHKLYESATFGACVTAVTPFDGRWCVKTANDRKFIFDAVICTTGRYWEPVIPEFATRARALAAEDCRVLHSSEYKEGSSLEGQRVLVVGGGNSAADIACDAAIHAAQASISFRRAYHFLPKYLFGVPTSVFADRFPAWLPFRLQQMIMTTSIARTTGSSEHHGLPKPDHGILERHPVINDQILEHCRKGELGVRSDVKSVFGKRVDFVDGSWGSFDTIICGTGFEARFPFLAPELLPVNGGKPDLYLHMFNADHPTLILMGMMEVDNGTLPVYEACASVISHYLQDKSSGKGSARKLEQFMSLRPDTHGNRRLFKSRRHINYVHKSSYLAHLKQLHKHFGWRELLANPRVKEAVANDLLEE